MAYTPTTWVNDSSPALSAENLNKIETGIAEAHNTVANFDVAIDANAEAIIQERADRISAINTEIQNYDATIDTRLAGIVNDPGSATYANIEVIVDNVVSDPNSDAYASVASQAVTAVDTEFSLSALTSDLTSVFGSGGTLNTSTINSKLATYADADVALGIAELSIDTNGTVTGWKLTGSETVSDFTITADSFQIKTASGGNTPFFVDGNDVYFNGKINFTNHITDIVDGINNTATTIDGGTITTGTITSSNIASNTITSAKIEAGHIGSTDVYSGRGDVLSTDRSALGSTLTELSSSEIMSFTVTNPLSFETPVNLFINMIGRSGYTYDAAYDLTDLLGTSCNWGVFDESGNLVYEYGWTRIYPDTRAGAFVTSLASGQSKTFTIAATYGDSVANDIITYLGFAFDVSVIGVRDNI